MTGRRVLAVVSYIVLSMAIAYPWHLIWFHDVYHAMGAVTRPEPNVPLGMLSMLIQGLVIAHLYPLYYRGGNPIVEGIKFSMIVGLMVYSVMGPATAAKFDINPISTFLAYHTTFQVLQFLITGIALGAIFGRMQPLPSTARENT
ncbi:MAG: DUF1761 domain-containing protein [Candidatus Hydrogenedentes bacterium]|nr:DUF1761 domain-containing protein [Candidatus Hydrogenedentota bacterium]